MTLIIAIVAGCICIHLVRLLLRLTNDDRYGERFAIRNGYRPVGDSHLDASNMQDIVTDAQSRCLILAPILGMVSIGCLIDALGRGVHGGA